jgi:hypothetical protein
LLFSYVLSVFLVYNLRFIIIDGDFRTFYQNDIAERRVWLRIEIGLGAEGVEMAPNPKFRGDFSDYNPKIWYDFLD